MGVLVAGRSVSVLMAGIRLLVRVQAAGSRMLARRTFVWEFHRSKDWTDETFSDPSASI
jgi:hypothetical protein